VIDQACQMGTVDDTDVVASVQGPATVTNGLSE
jgi:hypothetical protein